MWKFRKREEILSGMSKNYQAAIVRKWFLNGTNVNFLNKDNWSGLHTVVRDGHLDIVQTLLVKCDADVNILGKNSVTALHLAAYDGHVDIVHELLAHGADVNILSKDNLSPLHVAAAVGHVDIVHELLAHGADINVLCKEHLTPLQIACKNNNTIVFNVLLKNGANINIKNNEGQTVLQEIEIAIENLEIKIKNYKPNIKHINESDEKTISHTKTIQQEVLFKFGWDKIFDCNIKNAKCKTDLIADKESNSQTSIINDNTLITEWIEQLKSKKKMLNALNDEKEVIKDTITILEQEREDLLNQIKIFKLEKEIEDLEQELNTLKAIASADNNFLDKKIAINKTQIVEEEKLLEINKLQELEVIETTESSISDILKEDELLDDEQLKNKINNLEVIRCEDNKLEAFSV